MRKRFEQQLDLGQKPIPEVRIPTRSRDELPPVLMGLQLIFTTPDLNERVFELLESRICGDKQETGRPGMDLWEILVLGVVRLALDCDYDRLHHTANFDGLVRGILGVSSTGFTAGGKEYKYQTIRDNVTLLDEETINKINAVVVEAGHRVVKKKEDQGLKVKADTYVLETNVHYPTDTSLLWDSGRKCLDVLGQLGERYGLCGWRKHEYWRRGLKNLYRKAARTVHSGGRNKEDRLARDVGAYLGFARRLDERIEQSRPEIDGLGAEPGALALKAALDYYQGMLRKHIDLVERRLLKGETIPHGEKLFSIFEPHSEWLAKGKAGNRVEIGHKILLASDQYHFILHHEVVEGKSDYQLGVALAAELVERYGSIASLSLDKGFYSKANFDEIQQLVGLPVMPKKGRLSQAEQERESGKEFKTLKRKHSAVESNINQLESNGLNRCPDKGLEGFKRYAAYGVLSYNLHRLGSLLLEAERKRERKQARKAA